MNEPEPLAEIAARVEPFTRAAVGYCELGMWQSAWDELDMLEPEDRALPAVLHLRLRIWCGLERFDMVEELARSMVAKGDRTVCTWLMGACAIRRTHHPAAALAFLERAYSFLQGNAEYLYALARYCCLSGDNGEARLYLWRCFAINREFRQKALDEEDFEPVW